MVVAADCKNAQADSPRAMQGRLRGSDITSGRHLDATSLPVIERGSPIVGHRACLSPTVVLNILNGPRGARVEFLAPHVTIAPKNIATFNLHTEAPEPHGRCSPDQLRCLVPSQMGGGDEKPSRAGDKPAKARLRSALKPKGRNLSNPKQSPLSC